MYCYVEWQNREGEHRTLEEWGNAVGNRERRQPYAASTAQAWTVPGGSVPGPATILAIAELAGADPGWATYGRARSKAPAPEGVDLFPSAVLHPRRRRRLRSDLDQS